MKEKCIVILSGGPDSATVAYWAKSQGYEVSAVTFDYGQKAKKEIEYAKKIANNLGINHIVVDLSKLEDIYKGATSLVDENIEITSEFSDPIIVPFRNGVFMAVTVAYANTINAQKIFYGAHASDEPFYPDCRKEFYKAFEKAARLGTGKPIIIDSPYNDIPKHEIIIRAQELGVPLEETWSCYLNGPIHCGKCESCNNRKQAFKQAEIKDPTKYKI